MEYGRIFAIGITYVSVKWGRFYENFLRLKFSKALMKPGIVQGQNEHNRENQW